MKKLITLLFLACLWITSPAQTFCDPAGNVIIYSNYDGGQLTINVDQNIPNLKIGILSYEFSRITITGTYAANVTQVWYVGYDGNNDHCSLGAPLNTTITGVPANVDSIILYPAATYTNPNGYSSMICNYSCNTTQNQGGCNTADQTAHYFLTHFGGSLYFHRTAYGCWPSTVNISMGGNCCANPLTDVHAETPDLFDLTVNPIDNSANITMQSSADASILEIVNVMGEVIERITVQPGTSSLQVSLSAYAPGGYFFRMQAGEICTTEKVIVTPQ